MNIRCIFILAVSLSLLPSGCVTPTDEGQANEKHIERMMRHHDWPRIQQIAKAEVEKREKILGWPDNASYVPAEHKDKLWVVMAMAGTPNGDVKRVVTLMIGDDGSVLSYNREEAR